MQLISAVSFVVFSAIAAITSAMPATNVAKPNVKIVVTSMNDDTVPAKTYFLPVDLIPAESLLENLLQTYNDIQDADSGFVIDLPLQFPEQFPAVMTYLQNGQQLPRDICRTCDNPFKLHATLGNLMIEND